MSTKWKMNPSNKESRVSGGTSEILPIERAKATFDSEKLTNFLDGGADQTKRRRFIIKQSSDADLSEKFNLGRPELMKEHVKHFLKIHESFWDTWKPTRDDVVWMMESAVLSGSLMNHYGLFVPTIDVQASDQQREWWHKRAMRCQIIGSYAQTELGHGSNVRGLSTIAEYDKNKGEFVLNTPTLRSIKWWPGTLGKVATHAIVYAQLLINGKEYGVHAFMVQIRDENHKPLLGIELGDVGTKLGDHANDTGYMTMENVRIPREFMLSRFQQITPEGEYIKSKDKEKNAKLHYATMMFTRGSMIKGAGGYLARAVTNATRYSCIRAQGFIDTKRGTSYKAAERPIIDYQVQRYRLFRQISMTYAIKISGSWMLNRFKDMEIGSTKLGNLDMLPEIAAISSGLKALCTYFAWFGIEDCRKACGGNGYLMSSGIAHLSADYVWQTTAEGDWIILMLQTAQFLLKSLQNAMSGKPISDIVSYLSPLQTGNFDINKVTAPTARSIDDFFNLEFLQNLLKYGALISVVNVGQSFQEKFGETGKFDEALNGNAVELCNTVRAHCIWFMFQNLVRAVSDVKDDKVRDILAKVAALFATSNILDDSNWNGLLIGPQVVLVKKSIASLLDLLRPDAVALVDAFDIPDHVLMSAIGKKDGNVYEALFESAQHSSLNKTDPFDGYKDHLQPYLDLPFLKAGNVVPNSKL
jgi:acyl-CoA oxidase